MVAGGITRITIRQMVGDDSVAPAGSGTTNTRKRSRRLETLCDLYDRTLISREVCEAERAKAVREYTNEDRYVGRVGLVGACCLCKNSRGCQATVSRSGTVETYELVVAANEAPG